MTANDALAELLRYLKSVDYRFIAVTPATHAQYLTVPPPASPGLRDIFGWNRPFEANDVDDRLMSIMRAADALEMRDGRLFSKVRVASLGDDLLLHGGFPTKEVDSVFFGPDSYRFARVLQVQLRPSPAVEWLVDMGAGTGAGAIAASRVRTAGRTTLVDVNSRALSLAAINAAAAGLEAETLLSDSVPEGPDLIIANPPYMMDAAARSYRDGGDLLGGAVALDWVVQALDRLAPGGTMLLYTGAAFVGGQSPLLASLAGVCTDSGAVLEIEEIDPDVFGDELRQPHYAGVERIAAVGAAIRTAIRRG